MTHPLMAHGSSGSSSIVRRAQSFGAFAIFAGRYQCTTCSTIARLKFAGIRRNTSRPRNNQRPGQVSFDRLNRMYGTSARAGGSIATLLALDIEPADSNFLEQAMSLFHDATFAANENGGEEVHELDQIDVGDGYSVLIWRMLV